MNSHAFGPLIDPLELAAAENCIVFDCRFDLSDPEAGYAGYLEEHIPGAVYAHLDRELAAPVTADSGRHPLPDAGAFSHFLAQRGWRPGRPLVAYDTQGGAMAARLWWLMRWLGQRNVAVLDGGLGAWKRADLPVESGKVSFVAVEPVALEPQHGMVVDAAALQAGLDEDSLCLVDARAPERFRGDVEPLDTRAGHVPGAVNAPFTDNLDADGRFLADDLLRQRFAAVTEMSPGRVAHMCGSGVTACHNLLAMEAAGLVGSRLYAGSWSEWIRESSRPVATGP